jgi:hypothetical protein
MLSSFLITIRKDLGAPETLRSNVSTIEVTERPLQIA